MFRCLLKKELTFTLSRLGTNYVSFSQVKFLVFEAQPVFSKLSKAAPLDERGRISITIHLLCTIEQLVNQNILPNYLKTFNYRTVRNLLPFNLDSGECALCLQFQDTAVHVFAKCSITRQIWSILQEVLNNITKTSFPLDNLTPLNFHVPTNFEIFTESIALILTVTNYCIWQTRKKQLDSDHQKLNTVKPSNVLARIFNHIKIREEKESLKTDQTNYEIIKKIRIEIGRELHNLFG